MKRWCWLLILVFLLQIGCCADGEDRKSQSWREATDGRYDGDSWSSDSNRW